MFAILPGFPLNAAAATSSDRRRGLGSSGCAGSAPGRSGSSASEPSAATRQTTAAAGQSANGADASRKPPTAGPTVPASPHESECTAK